MWPFRRKRESAAEIGVDEQLDEERDVGWDEFDREAELEAATRAPGMFGPLALTGSLDERRNRGRRPR